MNEIQAIFVDDNEELNAPRHELDKYPEIMYVKASDGSLAIDQDTNDYYRPTREKNPIQQALDDAFLKHFDEYMYRIESGITQNDMKKILNVCKANETCSHVFLDHDLTLTCHHGLLEETQLVDLFTRYVKDPKSFKHFAAYFFGSYKRYEQIVAFLQKLGEANVKRVILTKQPNTGAIEALMKLCRLDYLFDDYISSIKRKKEKLEIIRIEINKKRRKKQPQHQKSPQQRSPKRRSPKKKVASII